MTTIATGGLIFLLVIALMALGTPVAFAFLTANLIGAFILMGGWVGTLHSFEVWFHEHRDVSRGPWSDSR